MSDVPRFADIRKHMLDEWNSVAGNQSVWTVFSALSSTLAALAAQEAIRESVPVRSPYENLPEPFDKMAARVRKGHHDAQTMLNPPRPPEPGPTLAEQIEHMRRVSETWRLTDGGEAWHMRKAILASLERLARESDYGR